MERSRGGGGGGGGGQRSLDRSKNATGRRSSSRRGEASRAQHERQSRSRLAILSTRRVNSSGVCDDRHVGLSNDE
jgi:hypothetical protein